MDTSSFRFYSLRPPWTYLCFSDNRTQRVCFPASWGTKQLGKFSPSEFLGKLVNILQSWWVCVDNTKHLYTKKLKLWWNSYISFENCNASHTRGVYLEPSDRLDDGYKCLFVASKFMNLVSVIQNCRECWRGSNWGQSWRPRDSMLPGWM